MEDPKLVVNKCAKENCQRRIVAKGLCNVHYKVWQTKRRVETLRGIIQRADDTVKANPMLKGAVEHIVGDARELFRETKSSKQS